MKAVENWQKKKIYAIANSLKYVDRNDKENDILHLLLYNRYACDSVKDLTYNQANEIINYLQAQQNGLISESMSEGQKKKVFALMYQLIDLDTEPSFTPMGERLAGIIEKQFKVPSSPKYLFTHLTKEQGNSLIEILKHYISSAEKKWMN